MNVTDAILSRKSVRTYTGGAVSAEQLSQLLEAANYAPVGRAKYENVHLTVIEDRKILSAIEENAAKVFGNPDMRPLYGAPLLILVSAKADGTPLGNVEYSNAAIIVHNMVLQATELGLGCCHIWGTIMVMAKNDGLVGLLNLPDGFAPCCAIAVGPTEEKYEKREIDKNRIGTNYLK